MLKKIVKLNGGLGNQMFQYAFALALAKRFNTKVTLDMSWFDDVKTHTNVTPRVFELDVFNIDYDVATKEDLGKMVSSNSGSLLQKALWKLFKIKKFKPQKNVLTQRFGYSYDKNFLQSEDYTFYAGYFQNEKYFKHVREELLKNFTSEIELDEKNKMMLDKIETTNSVSIHVRRGDYVTLECAKNFHGTCALGYYENAIKHIAQKIENPHFFLFSDDIDWVIKNLKIEYPVTVVDFNQGKGWLDLNLMKNCKHNITANSSFSWWGAWLNNNPNKIVVSPKQWTTLKQKCDVTPKEWVKL